MSEIRVWIERSGQIPQPCLANMVGHMTRHYGYKMCPDQIAAEMVAKSYKPKRRAYDVKAYWRKARRG